MIPSFAAIEANSDTIVRTMLSAAFCAPSSAILQSKIVHKPFNVPFTQAFRQME